MRNNFCTSFLAHNVSFVIFFFQFIGIIGNETINNVEKVFNERYMAAKEIGERLKKSAIDSQQNFLSTLKQIYDNVRCFYSIFSNVLKYNICEKYLQDEK